MEKISVEQSGIRAELERGITEEREVKKKMAKGFFGMAGITAGIFIMLAVVAAVTTEIKLREFEDFAAFALDFFLLLFCAYSMYLTCSDSGMRSGLGTEAYRETVEGFEKLKAYVIGKKLQSKMSDFCMKYVKEELKSSRMSALAVVGYSYDEFERLWLGKSEDAVNEDKSLSASQKKAIIKALRTEPVKLTPEMILKRGRGSLRRAPLGITPEAKKGINFGIRFFNTFVVAGFMSVIALEIVFEPTWVIVAQCCLKLIAVVMNGFAGYKFGYENIVFDTVGYVTDQTDLMRRAIDMIEAENEK